MQKLISIDLKADFGFFRKPDTNDGINLSFNMLHKPALLGILGAIIGLSGYKEYGKLPEYYEKLNELKVGIEPINHENGNFIKTVIKYSNTIGYANKGANYLTEEATLIKPEYRCYILLNMDDENHSKLFDYLSNGKAEYLPYFGKNEFFAWWDVESFREYQIKIFDYEHNFRIKNLIYFDDNESSNVHSAIAKATVNSRTRIESSTESPFMYFERLPLQFESSNAELETDKKSKYAYQSLKKFVFSNVVFDKASKLDLENLYQISDSQVIHIY